MTEGISQDNAQSGNKITTIKLTNSTKKRIENLKLYPRETYEEILQRILNILNITIKSPESARNRLIELNRQRKRNFKEVK